MANLQDITAAKARAELRLRRDLNRSRRSIVRQVMQSLSSNGQLPDVAGLTRADLETTLATHYQRVGRDFSQFMNRSLPAELRLAQEELDLLALQLESQLGERAVEQAASIATTTVRDIEAAINIANIERDRIFQATGRSVSLQEYSTITGNTFNQRLQSRVPTISQSETQAPSEMARQAEVNALTRAPERVMKTWVSQGDSRTRAAHLAADGQSVPVNEPFIVSSDRLMHPGDGSLGASRQNIINCRCSAIYDERAVEQIRREQVA